MNVVLTFFVIVAVLSFLVIIGEEIQENKEIFATTFKILVIIIAIMVGMKVYGQVIPMDVKEYLGQIKDLELNIKHMQEELEELRSVATKITSTLGGERVQSSGSNQKMADAVCSFVDLEKEISAKIAESYLKKREIIKTIELLDYKNRDFLYKVYVQGYSLSDVASMSNKEYGWSTYRHGVALERLREIMKEREK